MFASVDIKMVLTQLLKKERKKRKEKEKNRLKNKINFGSRNNYLFFFFNPKLR